MGCFLACLGGEKGQRPQKRGRKSLRGRAEESYQALITSPSPKKLVAKEVVADDDPIPQLREKSREQEEESFGCGGCRKKVTFDLNVKTYEAEEEKKAGEEEEEEGEAGRAVGGPVAFPANHRYGNCAGSDEEDNVIDDTEEEEEEYSEFDEEEESYDSFFSLPPEDEQQRSCQEVSSSSCPLPTAVPDRAATARDRSRYAHSVLNPVQNLSQWKEAKVRGIQPKNPDKENIDRGNIKSRSEVSKTAAFGPEQPTFKVSDTPVDASLSAWLVTPQSGGKAPREQRLAQV